MARRGARQEALDLDVDAPKGRVERRVAGAIVKAKREDALTDLDDGLAVLAVELARAVDVGARKPDPYAVATAARELREVLARLKLDPTSRGATQHDPIADFLAGLGAAEVGHPADAGQG